MSLVQLCRLEDIAVPGAIELNWGESDWPLSFFVVRIDGEVYGYLNRCPHAGHELNLRPNDFLTREGDLIMCRSHGAQFRIDDGFCVAGPCPGTSLKSIGVDVVDGFVCAERNELDRIVAIAQTRR
jgi:nitrite reductase/ring-hydroxylating ferredoxin subunit